MEAEEERGQRGRKEGKNEGRKEGKKRGMEWRRAAPEQGGHVPGVTIYVCLLAFSRVLLAFVVY